MSSWQAPMIIATTVSMSASAAIRPISCSARRRRREQHGDRAGPDRNGPGGGIWNGTVSGSVPPIQLTLAGSTVTGNRLTASPGIAAQGGGLYTTITGTLTGSTIARNVSDQCFGCLRCR
jgi:hypothetical protein